MPGNCASSCGTGSPCGIDGPSSSYTSAEPVISTSTGFAKERLRPGVPGRNETRASYPDGPGKNIGTLGKPERYLATSPALPWALLAWGPLPWAASRG